MRVGVNLHVHESTASRDSRTPAGHMAEAYCSRVSDFTFIGYVGHDRRPTPRSVPMMSLLGVERSVNWSGRELHIIEFADQDFSFLAHPGMTFSGNVRARAFRAVRELGLDAVEKYNGGTRQYAGSIPTLELAGDDAHSPVGVGRSFMVVDVDRVSADAVMGEIRRGNFDVVNQASPFRGLLHMLEKAAALATERLTSLRSSVLHGANRKVPRDE